MKKKPYTGSHSRRWLFAMIWSCVLSPFVNGAHENDQQFAPPEAYLPGDPLPYFGSENPWDRRFFERADTPRLGQPQLILIQEGQLEEAMAMCRLRLAEDGGEVESHLLLAVALGLQGRINEAEESLIAALDHGLPPERILVGPRSLFDPLRETSTFRTIEASSNGLLHGPMLGAVTDRSARFWVRTLTESQIEVRVSPDGHFESADAAGSARISSGNDYTAVVEIDGLNPATTYHYQVLIDSRPVPTRPEWQFRTFPSTDSDEVVRIAFGGGAMYWPPNERIWDTIRLRDPDAFLILGDNVYIDIPESVGAFHDYTYYQRQSRPEFRRLVAGTPIYAIWDDHDAGIDDVFLGPYPDKPAWKLEHFELFRRNWNNPSYGAEPDWPAVWFKMRIGAVECFMLDGRYYRENPFGTNPSMLGPVQKQWLLEGLRESTAVFKLIVSPVAWADDAKVREETGPNGEVLYATDTWAGFKGERGEIFDFLAENDISGVLLLSADRHRADLRRIKRPNGYPLYDLMCCRLTNRNPGSLSGYPLWEYNDLPALAVLTFDPSGPDPVLSMEVATIEGVPVLNKDVRLSELRNR
jgi:alkaline phosphatase D